MTSENSSRRRTVATAVVSAACLAIPLLAAGPASASAPTARALNAPAVAEKPGASADPPRTVITTDPELDDLNSLLRMLLYSNEIDIAGLVYSASQHHYEGDPEKGIEPHRWPEPDARFHIDDAVDQYEEVYPNLVVHDADYPAPEELRELIRWGNVTDVGDTSEDTAGSDHIKQILLDDEPGQVFLQAWGGANTIARALKSIQEEYEGTADWERIHDKVSQKAVLTSWGQQDTTFVDEIRPNWPELEHREVSTSIWGYSARSSALPEWQQYLEPEWTKANVSDVGPIGDAYRVWGDGKQMAAGFDDEDYFGLSGYTADELREMGYLVWTPPQPPGAWISEGDSSNWALLLQNGLRNYEDPSWGGWGGRQELNPEDPHQWRNRGVADIGPDGAPRDDYAAGRWFEDFQHDFAARLQWSVTPEFDQADHPPVARVAGPLDRGAVPGQRVALNGFASDPDGDDVARTWWQYVEAGTYEGEVELEEADAGRISFTVPEDAESGETIHLILEASDGGELDLKHWQRVVITVR
ncbi:DUF1593 domain-containing protein [Microbacterium sp. G2-8]|uniref:DUF1593 domain-containing protein n=1 Tax=Microbacterium sp. G2-8 TaxID=2842454 RepID=UPI001C8A2600|nr:DUF1593 domain-containing protein [Microbacterium sp. G2-8]